MGSEQKNKMKEASVRTCLGITVVMGICCLIGGVLVVFLFRGFVNQLIMNEIPIKEGSTVTKAWMDPPVRPLLRLYFFNTTNPEGFLRGEKPKLVELGPYTYQETWKKVNVKWSHNGSRVSYQIQKTYHFRRALSVGPESDMITLPNVPMFGSISQMKWAGKLVQQALGSMLEILRQEVFNSTSVRDIIWGYDHPLIKLGNDVLPPEKKLPFDKFGFFVDKNGSRTKTFEALTGANNVNDVGQVLSFDNKTKLDFWGSDDCNAIRGTDGSIFHPNIQKNETLYLFNKDLCQSLPLVYQEEVKHQGITTYRFVPPRHVFGTPAENPYNQCFCVSEGCNTPSGLFNISSCQFGSPMMLSWPHFFQADPKLREAVEGLRPRQDKHQFQMDIIPKMGVGMRASARTQINLVMEEVANVKQAAGVRDIIYPLFWFTDGIDEIDDQDTVALLHKAVHTPEVARSIMYPVFFVVGSLLVLATTAFVVRKYWLKPSEKVQMEQVSESAGLPMSGYNSITPPPDYRSTLSS